jgi:hypothetical protein
MGKITGVAAVSTFGAALSHNIGGVQKMIFATDSLRVIQAAMRAILALAFALAVSSAWAAEIVRNGDVVSINGGIDESDYYKFVLQTTGMARATVRLNSPGGSLAEALAIGRVIRLRQYGTAVDSGNICHSACPLIWLAGSPRQLAATASLGFHSAWTVGGERSTEGNRRIDEYLAELRIPSRLRVWMTTADPRTMGMMTRSDAERWGLLGFNRPCDFECDWTAALRRWPETIYRAHATIRWPEG